MSNRAAQRKPLAALDAEEPSAAQLAELELVTAKYRTALVIVVGEPSQAGSTDEFQVGHSSQPTGDVVTELLSEAGFNTHAVVEVNPKRSEIRKALETGVIGGADLILTIGGVGVGPRNKTPDATRDVLDQILPGVAQAVRASALSCGAIDGAVSRGIAGVSASTVIVNLAPSRAAIRDGMATITPLVHFLIDQLRKWECD